MNWQKKIKRSFFNYCTRYLHSACLSRDQYDECYVYSWCICHYGPQVIKFEPTPVVRPPRSYGQFFFFGLLVTVLIGFHCNNYFFFIFSKSDNYFFLIIISFCLKNKSKNSKISRTNSEAALGPPDASLKRFWAARILYFALPWSNKRDVTLTHLRSAVWNPIMYCQEYFTLLTTKPKSILGASVPDALYELWTVSVFN